MQTAAFGQSSPPKKVLESGAEVYGFETEKCKFKASKKSCCDGNEG